MLAVRIQVIDGARTFTLQDSQPCRLLPFHLLRIPDTLLANDMAIGVELPALRSLRGMDSTARPLALRSLPL
jgi:hypothetical protein